MPNTDPSKSDKFYWQEGDIKLERGRWDLVIDQPYGWRLVQTLGDLLTWIAQERAGEDPTAVIHELVDTGRMAYAPATLLEELAVAGVTSADPLP